MKRIIGGIVLFLTLIGFFLYSLFPTPLWETLPYWLDPEGMMLWVVWAVLFVASMLLVVFGVGVEDKKEVK